MSVVDAASLQALLESTQQERQTTETQLQALEAQLQQLHTLRQKVQQLQSLEASLQQVMQQGEGGSSFDAVLFDVSPLKKKQGQKRKSHTPVPDYANSSFFPEMAFKGADEILTHRSTLNYEIFRAVVLNGGQATTRQIRDYLIAQRIRTPQGKTFENTTLSEMSARVAYLLKKGVLHAVAPGRFVASFGWEKV